MANETNQPTAEQSFRSSLEDTIVILTQLAPLCNDVAQLVEMCRLGLDNDAQLQLLIKQVNPLRLRQ